VEYEYFPESPVDFSYYCYIHRLIRVVLIERKQVSRTNMAKDTMKAVVFHGKLDVRVEDRPVPKIIDQTDIIIKVRYSALCGR
jgi:hypothetical protein